MPARRHGVCWQAFEGLHRVHPHRHRGGLCLYCTDALPHPTHVCNWSVSALSSCPARNYLCLCARAVVHAHTYVLCIHTAICTVLYIHCFCAYGRLTVHTVLYVQYVHSTYVYMHTVLYSFVSSSRRRITSGMAVLSKKRRGAMSRWFSTASSSLTMTGGLLCIGAAAIQVPSLR